MKKTIVGFALGTLLLLGAGALAYANDWWGFTGDYQIEESEGHLDEIMEILRETSDGKLSAEESERLMKEELAMYKKKNPPGLNNKIEELEGEVEKLKTENATLTTDIAAKDKTIEEKDVQVADLEIQLENSADQEYVNHLESELQRANEKVKGHNTNTEQALNEAKEIRGEE